MSNRPTKYALLTNIIVVGTLLLLINKSLPNISFLAEYDLYSIFHFAIELASCISLLMIAGYCLSCKKHVYECSKLFILGSGVFWIAILEFGHALSYEGMPHFITPSSPDKAIYFWLVSRYILMLCVMYIALTKPNLEYSRFAKSLYFIGIGFLTFLTYWVILFNPDSLPKMFLTGIGLTKLKITLELIFISLSFVTVIFCLRINSQYQSIDFYWMAGAMWMQMLADSYFTLYEQVTGLLNAWGHIYVLVGYLMIYKSINNRPSFPNP